MIELLVDKVEIKIIGGFFMLVVKVVLVKKWMCVVDMFVGFDFD